MIDPAYVQRMARYNRWQNQNLYGVADTLGDDERRRERGAFFGSIHNTLSHLRWGDQMWMSRWSDVSAPSRDLARSQDGVPDFVSLYGGWDDLKRDRVAFDEFIIMWADNVDPAWLKTDLTWFSGGAGREQTRPVWDLVAHFFNHQTHHRGQVHCMLTQAGGKPHATDLMVMPE
jgi:uncharacterized damage-inducible protein DinB